MSRHIPQGPLMSAVQRRMVLGQSKTLGWTNWVTRAVPLYVLYHYCE